MEASKKNLKSSNMQTSTIGVHQKGNEIKL